MSNSYNKLTVTGVGVSSTLDTVFTLFEEHFDGEAEDWFTPVLSLAAKCGHTVQADGWGFPAEGWVEKTVVDGVITAVTVQGYGNGDFDFVLDVVSVLGGFSVSFYGEDFEETTHPRAVRYELDKDGLDEQESSAAVTVTPSSDVDGFEEGHAYNVVSWGDGEWEIDAEASSSLEVFRLLYGAAEDDEDREFALTVPSVNDLVEYLKPNFPEVTVEMPREWLLGLVKTQTV